MRTVAFVMCLSLLGYACTSDSDCRYGAVCLRQNQFDTYGVCTGGDQPGNRWDNHPIINRLNPSSGIGKTCTYDGDCGGFQSHCVKEGFATYGVCM